MPIEMIGHESTSSAFWGGTLFPQPLDLSRIINLVKLKNGKLHLLLLVLDLLGLGVSLLLPLSLSFAAALSLSLSISSHAVSGWILKLSMQLL